MWSKSVSTALGGQRWNSEGIGPQSCSQRSRMVILLLAQHYLLHTSQLHMATLTLNISGSTWALGQLCSSKEDHSFVLPNSQILRLKTMRRDACVTFVHLKVTLQQNAKNPFRTVFAKSLCLYLGCFPLCCAEFAVVEPLIDNPSLVATTPPVWPLACSSTLVCSSAPPFRKKSLKQKKETSQTSCNQTPSEVETLRQKKVTPRFLE